MTVGITRRSFGRMAVLFVIAVLVAAQAGAQDFRFHLPGLRDNEVDYLHGSMVQLELQMQVWHKGPAANYFITADAGQHGGGNPENRRAVSDTGAALDYQLYTSSGQMLTATSGISGSFPVRMSGGWQRRDIVIVMQVPETVFPAQGEYHDSFELQLYIGNTATGSPEESETISLTIKVPEIVDLQVGPPGAAYGGFGRSYSIDIDPALPGFGDGAAILVLANTQFALELSSDNGGVLSTTGAADTIPYRLRFADAWIAIGGTGAQRVVNADAPTDVTGRSYPLWVEIDEYDDLPAAGSYTDVLNITIVAP